MQMQRVLGSLAARVDPSAHPLLDERQAPKAGGRALLIVITADRGLCGSFNTNVIKAASTFITERHVRRVALGLVGRRGRDYFAPARIRHAVRAGQSVRTASLRGRAGDRDRRDRRVRQRRGRQRPPRLQRVQVGDAAAGRGRSAAADPAARDRAERAAGGAAGGLPVRAGAGGAVRAPASAATSKCRCSARCSNRTPRSSRRR